MAAYYNDNEKTACAWLRELIKQGHIAAGDVDDRPIQEVRPSDLLGYAHCHFFAGIGGWAYALQLAGWPEDKPVWTGSCPCQPFADCGERKGFDDDRHLWPDFFGLIQKQNPAIVFGEQVATEAALSWIDCVFRDLESADYACASADLCAAGILSPQRRQRLFWVADANNTRREGRKWERQQNQEREKWPLARSQSLRSDRGPWPPGPRDVGSIPVLADGLPGGMGRCRGYGNAIVPQVAAEFISAYLEAREDLHNGRLLTMADF